MELTNARLAFELTHARAMIADALTLRREGITPTGATWADWERAAARLLNQENPS